MPAPAYFCAEICNAFKCSSLGMCKRCGDLRMIACSRCKGRGSLKSSGPFSFNLIDDLSQSFGGGEPKVKLVACTKCKAKGQFCCPECSEYAPS